MDHLRQILKFRIVIKFRAIGTVESRNGYSSSGTALELPVKAICIISFAKIIHPCCHSIIIDDKITVFVFYRSSVFRNDQKTHNRLVKSDLFSTHIIDKIREKKWWQLIHEILFIKLSCRIRCIIKIWSVELKIESSVCKIIIQISQNPFGIQSSVMSIIRVISRFFIKAYFIYRCFFSFVLNPVKLVKYLSQRLRIIWNDRFKVEHLLCKQCWWPRKWILCILCLINGCLKIIYIAYILGLNICIRIAFRKPRNPYIGNLNLFPEVVSHWINASAGTVNIPYPGIRKEPSGKIIRCDQI